MAVPLQCPPETAFSSCMQTRLTFCMRCNTAVSRGSKKNKNKNKPKKTFARTHAAAHDCAYDSPKICMWHLTKRMRMLCRAWLAGLSEASPEMVPHPLPSREQLAAMTHDLPLQCEAFVDEP